MLQRVYHTVRQQVKMSRGFHSTFIQNSQNKKIDYSRVPVLNENDLVEQAVKGSGPGGQAVNKTNNCVVLCHKPTGIVIKCHLHRLLQKNQTEARRLLIVKLDNRINGENSVENQKKRILDKRSSDQRRKRQKINELKSNWKKENDSTD